MRPPDPGNGNAPLREQRGAEGNTAKLYADDSTLLSRWRLLGEACCDANMSRASLAVLHSIADRVGKDGTAWPSIRRIASDTGLDNRTVTRVIKVLVKFSYLIRQSGNRTEANIYRLGVGDSAHRVRASLPLGAKRPVGANLSEGCGQGLQKGVGEPAHVILPLNLPIEPSHSLVRAKQVPADASSRFDEFWKAYPRKVGSKEKLAPKWKAKKLDRIADQIITNVVERTAHDRQWQEKRFIPHPSTYLNQSRWLDEWERVGTGSAAGEEQPPAGLSAVEKVEWHLTRRKSVVSVQSGGRTE